MLLRTEPVLLLCELGGLRERLGSGKGMEKYPAETMARPRRLLWLLVPALVGGAFLLPASDEFAAVRGGRRVDPAWVAEELKPWLAPDARRYREERAYAFDANADAVERTLRRNLVWKKGWNARVYIVRHPTPVEWERVAGREMRYYSQSTSEDAVVTIRYWRPVNGVRFVAIVREARGPWRHLKRRLERMVGR